MPAYASHSIDYAIQKLGARVNEERRRQGLTLQELAARSGISVSRLSQIENGHHVLDAVQADAIAEAFGLSLEAFLPADVTIPYVVARDAEIRTTSPGEASVESALLVEGEQSWPLAERFVGRHLEPLLTRLAPGADRFCYHHEHEFTFVLQGAIEFTIKTPGGVQREELAARRLHPLPIEPPAPGSRAWRRSRPSAFRSSHRVRPRSRPARTGG